LPSSSAIEKNIQMKNNESYVLDRAKTYFLNQSGHLKPLGPQYELAINPSNQGRAS